METLFFANPDQWRSWLAQNHATVTTLQVGFHKKGSGRPSVTYQEALDEALCYGWIDGVRRRLDDESYTIRFTPRRARSYWSQVNVKRAEELIAAGRMAEPGLVAYNSRLERPADGYSYENRDRGLAPELEAILRQDEAAWAFYAAQPPSYRHMAAWFVMSAKQDVTRRKRLARLIADSAAGRRI
jgi:uncharacterized protein YdeI (YjbR/CyaY-like superfamily)